MISFLKKAAIPFVAVGGGLLAFYTRGKAAIGDGVEFYYKPDGFPAAIPIVGTVRAKSIGLTQITYSVRVDAPVRATALSAPITLGNVNVTDSDIIRRVNVARQH